MSEAVEVLWQDEALVAVAKPSGLVVHRGPGTAHEPALLQLARDATGGEHLYPVHRLDRGVISADEVNVYRFIAKPNNLAPQ